MWVSSDSASALELYYAKIELLGFHSTEVESSFVPPLRNSSVRLLVGPYPR